MSHTFGKDPMQDEDIFPNRGYADFDVLHHAKNRHRKKLPTWNEQRERAFSNEYIHDGERTARGVGFDEEGNLYPREAPASASWFSSWLSALFGVRAIPEGQDREDNLYWRG